MTDATEVPSASCRHGAIHRPCTAARPVPRVLGSLGGLGFATGCSEEDPSEGGWLPENMATTKMPPVTRAADPRTAPRIAGRTQEERPFRGKTSLCVGSSE